MWSPYQAVGSARSLSLSPGSSPPLPLAHTPPSSQAEGSLKGPIPQDPTGNTLSLLPL